MSHSCDLLSDFDTNLVLSQHWLPGAVDFTGCDLLSDFDTNLVLSQQMTDIPITFDCCDLLSDFDTNLVLSQRECPADAATQSLWFAFRFWY